MPAMATKYSFSGLLSWQKGDWNGFWALFADNLANMVILSGILIGVFQFETSIVFGRIIPGLSISLLFGLGSYVYMARKLAQKESRDDVTALPYGISTPVMFVYLFAVIGPIYFSTKDPVLAYQVGLGAAFMGGVVELLGSVLGPLLKRVTPRAAMLGTLAGIALVWIATVPMAIIFENPLIGLPALFIVILGLVGHYKLPFSIPAGLLAIVIGIAIGFFTGHSKIEFEALTINLPLPFFGDLLSGIRQFFLHPELIAIIVPIGVYNFIETMNNVESASAAGDNYDVRKCQIIDGIGTCVGSIFGACFPTTVYIGHPAYKRLGSKTGYAMGVGIIFVIASFFGVTGFLRALIPEAAVAPLLVFVGVVITQQAFSSVPKGHGIAVAFALIPHVADILYKQINGVLLELKGPGAATGELVAQLTKNQGVHLAGFELLAKGSIITGLMWGAIVASIVDGNLRSASRFSLLTFHLAMFGIIHASQFTIEINTFAYGYLIFWFVLLIYDKLKVNKQVED
jgi:AGZA family xanthine/uracil permease-like MFS transporter